MIEAQLKNAVLLEMNRLLATAAFVNANRSAALLRFLVNETLEDRASRLKEYVLGVEALGRPAAFDPRTDPIARVEASRLRTKLESCYSERASGATLRIVLPRGTYVPEFQPIEEPPQAPPKQGRGTALLAGIALAAFLLGIGVAAWWNASGQRQETLRFSLVPPANSLLQSLAASPDGKRIVVAASLHGTSHLYLRSLMSSFEPAILSGTEGAAYPFWSFDSSEIGFFAQGKLKVLKLDSGEPRVLADAPLGRGGAWSKRGDIVFAPGALGPLLRIPSTGGKPVPFSELDTSAGEVSHIWPAMLPDGVRLVFLAENRNAGLNSIISVDLSRPGWRTTVLPAYSSVAVSPAQDGRLNIFFLRDGSLVEQPLASDSLKPVGATALVAPKIDFEPLARYAFLTSSRGALLAFVPGSPFRYQLAWANRSGGEETPFLEPSDYYPLKLSTDDSELVTNETDGRTGNMAVSKVNLTRSAVSHLTSSSVDFFPIWSPDSAQVAFARSDGTAEKGMRLSVMPANGGSPQVLSDITGPVFPSDWSSDGKLIAYTGFSPTPQIHVGRISGKTFEEVWSYKVPYRSTGGAVFFPNSFHQPPQWIAYTSDESGRNEVYVQSFPDGKTKLQLSALGGNSPTWRHDGKELFYINADDDLMALTVFKNGSEFGKPERLFHMPAPLSTNPPYGLNYAATKEGQRFLVRHLDASFAASSISVITDAVSRGR